MKINYCGVNSRGYDIMCGQPARFEGRESTFKVWVLPPAH